MPSDLSIDPNLYLQDLRPEDQSAPIVVLGEVLWDVFPDSIRLGGAPLNFGVHARRLGYEVCLLSAVGADDLGREAETQIAALGLSSAFLQTTRAFPTGRASVELLPEGGTSFHIQRPAVYDALKITDPEISRLQSRNPGWLYYGTLFPSRPEGFAVLARLLEGLDSAKKFYDLNLRPGFEAPELVHYLMQRANVVKLNEEELERVHGFTGLPLSTEAFCREASGRYGWHAVAVTRGSRGCALFTGGEYVESAGRSVDVADTVGAGDAFAAALLHGVSANWPAAETAAFANRVGALVASRRGAIPDWTPAEVVNL